MSSDIIQRLSDLGAYASTFGKAKKLASGGGVLSCEVAPSVINGSVTLNGLVRASQPGSAYRVEVALDLTEGDVVDYFCTCPVGDSARGMCKHEVALALTYLGGAQDGGRDGSAPGAAGLGGAPIGPASSARVDGPASSARAGGFASQAWSSGPGAGGSGTPAPAGSSPIDPASPATVSATTAYPGAPSRPSSQAAAPSASAYRSAAYPPGTSPQIANLIANITTRRMDESAQARAKIERRQAASRKQEAPDLVELLPTLSPSKEGYAADGSQTWQLQLKVSRGDATYVVKNIANLTRAYLARQEFSYGKRLAFVHEPAAFTERARNLLDLLVRIVQSQQALYASRWDYRGAGRGVDVRELPLSDADAAALLDIEQGATVEFDPGTNIASRVRKLLVTRGDPKIEARLATDLAGGYILSMPPGLDCIAAPNALYVLDNDHAWRCSPEFAEAAGEVLPSLVPSSFALHIGQQDLPVFCRDALPALKAFATVKVPRKLADLVPPEPAFTFRIGVENSEVTCQATVAYGDRVIDLYATQMQMDDALAQPPISRDFVAEYHVQDVLELYFPLVHGALRFDETDDDRLFELLIDGLSDLGDLGEVHLSERLRNVHVRPAPQVRVKATVKSGLLDVAIDASGLKPADLRAYLDSYKRKQQFVRLSNGDIMRIGEELQTAESLAEGLGSDVVDLADGIDGLPQSRALFVDAMLKKTERLCVDRDAGFRKIVREIETFSDADIEMPPSLNGILRGYQVAGVRWLGTLERFGFGGILADDMGLAKTLQVIAHILRCKEAGEMSRAAGEAAAGEPTSDVAASEPAADVAAGKPVEGAAAGEPAAGGPTPGCPVSAPTLIVAPASLVYNWMAELARFAPQLDAVAVVGTKAARTRIIRGGAAHDVLVTSYDLMKRDIEAYTEQRYQRVVLDEAQYIKNPGTRAAKCAKLLPATVRFALTGTPIENRLAELWSIFDFLMPGILGTRDDFSKRFEGPVEAGEFEATNRLQCLVAPFILRRLKTDVLSDLPEKSESTVLAHMEGEQRKLYLANQDRLAMQVEHRLPDEFKREKLKVLAELMRLRQICCDPRLCYDGYRGGSAKLDACMELVRSAVDGGHGVLVFSQFVSMLDLIGERLDAERLGYLKLTGATAKEERARLVASFQAGEARVFLISLKAGGVGLNLTAADVVIHYDPWWNLAAQNQATDRAHRIGQQRAVSVFKLIAEGTIEEKIAQMQERKHDLAQAVLGGEEMASSSLTKEDVLALLGA